MEKIKILFRIKAGTGQPFYINHIKSALNGQTFHKEINGPLGIYFHLVDWMSKLCWKLKGYEEFIITQSLCKIMSSWWQRQRHVERTSKTRFFKSENFENLKEELGDLLLHIVFYSKIASEKKKFNFKSQNAWG